LTLGKRRRFAKARSSRVFEYSLSSIAVTLPRVFRCVRSRMTNAANAWVFSKVFTVGFAPFGYVTSKKPVSAAMPNSRYCVAVSAASAFVSDVPNGSAYVLV
jgi:hypothetical protein